MIYHFKDNIQNLPYQLKTPLKYSEDFTFIPIGIKNKEFIIQTPKVFVPYGIQTNTNLKEYVMISFQNKDNDLNQEVFIKNLQYIYELCNEHYKETYQVNHFLKEYKGETIMNLKIESNPLIFDSHKHLCEDLPLYSYASFIIQLAGLWISTKDNKIWFQWYILQTRIENKISFINYAFKDSIPPPPPLPPPPSKIPLSKIPPPPPIKKQIPDKYKKMISMGIPSAAVNQQKQIDAKAGINPQMLLSVQLKKGKERKQIIKTDMNGFEAPSLNSLQEALRNLRNTIKGT